LNDADGFEGKKVRNVSCFGPYERYFPEKAAFTRFIGPQSFYLIRTGAFPPGFRRI